MPVDSPFSRLSLLRSPVSLSPRTPVMPRMPSIRIRRATVTPTDTASTRRGKPTRK